MEITAFKFVIWGGKSAVLWLEIPIYGDTSRGISNRKTADLPP